MTNENDFETNVRRLPGEVAFSTVVLGFYFVMQGIFKFSPIMAERFIDWETPQFVRYATGIAEVLCGLALLTPLRLYAAVLAMLITLAPMAILIKSQWYGLALVPAIF